MLFRSLGTAVMQLLGDLCHKFILVIGDHREFIGCFGGLQQLVDVILRGVLLSVVILKFLLELHIGALLDVDDELGCCTVERAAQEHIVCIRVIYITISISLPLWTNKVHLHLPMHRNVS